MRLSYFISWCIILIMTDYADRIHVKQAVQLLFYVTSIVTIIATLFAGIATGDPIGLVAGFLIGLLSGLIFSLITIPFLCNRNLAHSVWIIVGVITINEIMSGILTFDLEYIIMTLPVSIFCSLFFAFSLAQKAQPKYPEDLCRVCGYDVSHTDSKVCSECGEVITDLEYAAAKVFYQNSTSNLLQNSLTRIITLSVGIILLIIWHLMCINNFTLVY